ncbi:unnamed protein product [Spirodela intermedia]|uniref:AAA+ ATPase domain-containing protein n=1 Tax=Spirodela intermedia TaxID=51605 RepID=A0A7I8JVU7_SPIIN|nr:unnamed protein product [Spirodela intermedia]
MDDASAGCFRPLDPSCLPNVDPLGLSSSRTMHRNLADSSASALHPEVLKSSSNYLGGYHACYRSAAAKACEVYIGAGGSRRSLPRFVNWLRAELESHGIHCFVSVRSRGRDSCAYSTAREAMRLATLGVLVVTRETFSSSYAMEEISWFSERSNLVPIFFGLSQKDCLVRDITEKKGELWRKHGGFLWEAYGGLEKEWRHAVNKLSCLDCKLETCESNFRDCILGSVVLVGRRLGRKGIVEKVSRLKESAAIMEYPFPRNHHFVGRNQELHQLELILFGHTEEEEEDCLNVGVTRFGRGLTTSNGASMELDHKGKYQESQREIRRERCWVEERRDGLGMHVKKSCHTGSGFSARDLYGKGIACVCGESGIGKTELLLEFAYRFSQRYKMVLWLGGEARYIRMNYLNLLPALGVNLSSEKETFLKSNGPISFKEVEGQTIRRVRKELMRDIPFLLVIDNLESGKDWWDGRNVMEILPCLGGQTHVLISTQMSSVMNLKPLKISFLSHSEAIALIKGHSGDLPPEDSHALDVAEEKLGRLPLGLAIFGALLSEVPISPRKLLSAIERMPHEDLTWNDGEQSVLKKYPSIVQLLSICSLVFDLADNHQNFASRMVLACGWFAPSPIPVNLLFTAASEIIQDNHCVQFLKKFRHMVACMHKISHSKKPGVEASSRLVRLRIAKCSAKIGCIHFHDIIKEYARKRGKFWVANAMVRAIFHKGSPHLHPEHVWAASFLLFRLGTSPPIVRLRVSELLAFISKFVLPLALDTFKSFRRCEAASELLFACEELLKNSEISYTLQENNVHEKQLFGIPYKNRSAFQFDQCSYKEFSLLRATILETRAEMMLSGGCYDTAERLFRSALNIKEVIYGCEHSDTVAIQETMKKLLRLQEGL